MEDSIFLKSLEIGYETQSQGISFNEMVSSLDIAQNLEKEESLKVVFVIWFFDNFYHYGTEAKVNSTKKGSSNGDFTVNKHTIKDDLYRFFDDKCFIKGDSIQRYLDFIELKEARESSRLSTKYSEKAISISEKSISLSRKAINLSIFSILASVLFGIASLYLSCVISEKTTNVVITENRDKDFEGFNQIISRLDSITKSYKTNNTINTKCKEKTQLNYINASKEKAKPIHDTQNKKNN